MNEKLAMRQLMRVIEQNEVKFAITVMETCEESRSKLPLTNV